MVESARARAEKSRPEALLPLVEYPDASQPTASEPRNVPQDQALTGDEKAQLAALTGWTRERQEFADWRAGKPAPPPWRLIARHLLGWLLTAIALSMGAPFWFDTLNRFMNIRNAGRVPVKTQPEATAA